ncbi:MAG: HIT domain-containing protein [Mycoplasmoidaceae bacterium]|nr:HIT domain-containing protein [Mycoplasmoidaceae bacterium]
MLDINLIADGHIVVISKKHYANLRECPDEVLLNMIKLSKKVENKIAESKLKP